MKRRSEGESDPIVGTAVPRLDAEAKVRGEARYADDLVFSGMVHVKTIRSERPHARVVRLDLSGVGSTPGVVGIATVADIPGENIVPIIYRDMPLLAGGVVRYVGEPLALVAAQTRDAAEEAAARARVEYEDLPAGVRGPLGDVPLWARSPRAPGVGTRGKAGHGPHPAWGVARPVDGGDVGGAADHRGRSPAPRHPGLRSDGKRA